MSECGRRELLRGGALAAFAGALPSSLLSLKPQSQGPGEAPIRLGVASYTFRNFSRAQLIGFMQQLQVSELNAKDVKDHLPSEPVQESAALADYGAHAIHLHAAGAIYFQNKDERNIRSTFEYCKRAGIQVIVAGDPTLDTLPLLERYVKKYDIRLAIHNHGPEDKLWPAPEDVLKAVQSMDPRIGCCIDVGHAARAGSDVVAAIGKAGPRLFNIHMKDLTDFSSRESQVAVGEGLMPVRAIFETLVATGYRGYVDLEYEVHPDDPLPGVMSSFAYMRGVMAGMRADKS